MTKADLVKRVSEEIGPGLSKRECSMAVEAILTAIKDGLERGEAIEIRGFGTFRVRHRKSRKGQNPNTGQTVVIPPRRVPVFQPSKLLSDRVDLAHDE